MKKLLTLFIILTTVSLLPLSRIMAQLRTVTNLDRGWQFSKGAYGAANSRWQAVSLPHTWNVIDVMDDEPGYYRGPGVYTKNVFIPASDKAKQIYLYINGANQLSAVYVNGAKIASHTGGYTRFYVNLSKYLKFGAQNKLAISVDNSFNEDIPPLTADFTFYGGLYRDVYLVKTNSAHFDNENAADGIFITTPVVSANSAVVAVRGSIVTTAGSSLTITTKMIDKAGKEVAKSTQKINGIQSKVQYGTELPRISNPQLWSPERPYLYKLISTVSDTKTGKLLDRVIEPLGLRWYKFDPDNGFYLNGKPLKLIGVSRHQDLEGKGNALTAADHIRDVALIKKMGGNFLRVAHYPQDKKVLDACDSLGVLASIEIPLVNAITESAAFTRNSANMLTEMIDQNFNHPSIVIWAYMNEILLRPKYGNDKPRQQEYFKNVRNLAVMLDSMARKQDPSRYTMIACHGDFNRYRQAGIVDVPMVIGWNLYQGWYGGKTDDFGKFLDKFHQEYPKLPMLITEYGADADSRINALTPERFDKSIEYAVDFHRAYLDAMMKRPFVSAGVIWNLADFNSEERAETTPHINSKGLLTYSRKPKDVYYFYQANLLNPPFIKISNWANRVGLADSLSSGVSTQPLSVFSNETLVSLKFNGKLVGSKSPENGIAKWDLPFIEGTNIVEIANNEGATDKSVIQFHLLPRKLATLPAKKVVINALLGAKRYFSSADGTEWMPSPAYYPGGFGYIGGSVFKLPGNGRLGYGTDQNVNKTVDDPVYQTQQAGIKSFKFDVADGTYRLTLHFAELTTNKKTEALAYNLDSSTKDSQLQDRVFNVEINGKQVLVDFDIAKQYGALTAGSQVFTVTASGGTGVTINFLPVKGEPVLNAVQLKGL